MKRVFAVLFLAAFMMPSLLQAAVEIQPPGPQRKIQRGFLNIAMCWAELGNEIVRDKKDSNPLFPFMLPGIIRGSFNTVGRAMAGAYDFVTFPIPAPKDYAPVMEPEFPWQYFKEKPQKNLKVSGK